MELIAGFMENYLALNAKEELAFQAGLDKIEDNRAKQRVMELMTSWERKGRQEGQLDLVKQQLTDLLGRISGPRERAINSLEPDRLSALGRALLRFSTVKDLDHWLSRQRVAQAR